MLSSAPLRPDSDKYSFEVKWDGFRALVRAAPEDVTITSRSGHDMTARYPELQSLRDTVSTTVLLLDGEIVALDVDSKPDFAALWFHSRGSALDWGPARARPCGSTAGWVFSRRPAETEGRLAVMELLAPKGFASPLHIHRAEDEFFVVLSGEVRVQHGEAVIKDDWLACLWPSRRPARLPCRFGGSPPAPVLRTGGC